MATTAPASVLVPTPAIDWRHVTEIDDLSPLVNAPHAVITWLPAGNTCEFATLFVAGGRGTARLRTESGGDVPLAVTYADDVVLEGVLVDRHFYAIVCRVYAGEPIDTTDVAGYASAARRVLCDRPGHAPSSFALTPDTHVAHVSVLPLMPVAHLAHVCADTPGALESAGVVFLLDATHWTAVSDRAALAAATTDVAHDDDGASL